jgi:hypothetical protein
MPRSPQIDTSFLEAALIGYQHELVHIDAKMAEIRRQLVGREGNRSQMPAVKPAKKRSRFSAAARGRIAAAQRKRWAEFKKAKEAPVKKRKMSPAARKRISEATKKRWAEFRAKKAALAKTPTKKGAVKKPARQKKAPVPAPKPEKAATV